MDLHKIMVFLIIYIIIIYTDINGVSPNEGSVSGGTMITIYGEYFDPNADSVEVLVGGKLQITIL